MRFAGAALVAVLGALIVAARAVDGLEVRLLRPDAAAPARPFEHSRHEVLECRECHGTGEQHRAILVRTPRDCASCHHDARRGFECTTCHRPAALPEARTVAATLALSVWDSARVRLLPFGHQRHGSVACTECHQSAVTLEMKRECRSCHATHDQPAAQCSSCHTADVKTTHQAEAHLSCAGGECHTPTTPFRPAAARNTCIACHAEQTNHEPGGDCAACHKIPAVAPGTAAARAGWP